jgi:putative endonuclease
VPRRNIRLGNRGEDAAVDFLKNNGYRILVRKYKNKIGEIDIVARDADTLCFVEVKTRSNCSCGTPLESVTLQKQRKIAQVALSFLKEKNLLEKKARFDVVGISIEDGEPKLQLIKNAFELDSRYV